MHIFAADFQTFKWVAGANVLFHNIIFNAGFHGTFQNTFPIHVALT